MGHNIDMANPPAQRAARRAAVSYMNAKGYADRTWDYLEELRKHGRLYEVIGHPGTAGSCTGD